MEQSDKTQNLNEKILLTLYDFEPSLSLYMKFLFLNKNQHLVRRICKYLGANLKALDFEFSTVTDEHIEVTLFPQTLIELNLNGCREISEKACMHLQKQCKNLERLELYWNCRITDFGLKKLAIMNPKLSYVNLSGCKYLSDSSIMTFAQNCPNIYHFVRIKLYLEFYDKESNKNSKAFRKII
ncbi:f-box lrr-repeat protein 20 [Stylonychia lemnae]|uniref:F-box lrr-repeat protein 20 n=1 Tax=Stylonychia lemnae TaxID=5949 RepID=A0A078AWU3_STYLE|nr:f-box lrr-repeat protein 20 [Stylonychia lemnae]|eukprot:CDW85727.1 f-box lrr-repeat protein 20 [Stylonychia lemnae]